MHVLNRLWQAQLGSIQKPLLKHQWLLQEFVHSKYCITSIIRTPLATGVRIRVRIIEIVLITKINTVLFERMRKLIHNL